MKSASIILLTVGLTVASCSGVKNLTGANTAVPERFTAEAWPDTASIADMEWWRYYADSTLCNVIEKTLAHNRNFLKAGARVEELRQLYNMEKVNMLPTLSGIAGGDYETNRYRGGEEKTDPETDLKFTLGWEVNLWGAMSWARKESAATYRASVEDLRAMQMTLVAEAATAYFRLMALDNELAIVRQTLITREEALKQAKLRFEGGLTSETVYQQAKVEYASTASLVPNLERQISVVSNALTLLMGELPSDDLHRGTLFLNVQLPEELPVGVPSQLLERRPDVRAAEQRLASAMAGVGLNYANRFPSLKINLSAGWENDGLVKFFESPFTYVLGNIGGTIFDFGKKKRKYKAAIAAYDQARYAYEQSVLTAFTEVSDAITTYSKVHESTALKMELRDATGKYVRLATLQYRAGSLNYLDVLDAQRRYFEAQIGVSNALRDEYFALINLYKVLGGGWQTRTS
ncbi:MAG: TolC family protein [Muribaculaceae bacterium]|nr:TolC family protein [Muribaculaceae bacterium]